MGRKGKKIRDHPLVVARPTGADDVTKEMEMEAHENKRCNSPIPRGQQKGDQRYEQAEEEVVAENMVVIAPPEKGGVAVPGERLCDDTEAVNVRTDSGQSNHGPFPAAKIFVAVGNEPSSK